MFSLICVWKNGWVNNREAGDLRRHRDNYDVNVVVMGFYIFATVPLGELNPTLGADFWIKRQTMPSPDIKMAQFLYLITANPKY